MSTSFVCDLTAIDASRRAAHVALAEELLHTAAQETVELPDGYALRFGADRYPAVAEFVAGERLCCPFFSFTLEVTPDRGPIWLRITGPGSVKAFAKAELGL